MIPEIEQLIKLAAQKITKGRLPALTKTHADACGLLETLQSKSTDEDDLDDFSTMADEVSEAGDVMLEHYITELNMSSSRFTVTSKVVVLMNCCRMRGSDF